MKTKLVFILCSVFILTCCGTTNNSKLPPLGTEKKVSGKVFIEHLIHGDIDKIEADLRAGFDLNARFESGKTALIISSLEGNDVAVSFLLDHSVSIDARDDYGRNALMLACSGGNLKIVESIFRVSPDFNIVDYKGASPAHLSARWGRVDVLDFIAQHGGRVDIRDINGETPLIVASEYAGPETVSFLLEHNCDPNIKSHEGYTPISMACLYNSIEVIKLLVNRGAQISYPDSKGWTPLHMAAARSIESPDIVSYLLKIGADPNAKEFSNKTPFDVAVEQGNLRCSRILKADPHFNRNAHE